VVARVGSTESEAASGASFVVDYAVVIIEDFLWNVSVFGQQREMF
jgi:hypothetical protein